MVALVLHYVQIFYIILDLVSLLNLRIEELVLKEFCCILWLEPKKTINKYISLVAVTKLQQIKSDY